MNKKIHQNLATLLFAMVATVVQAEVDTDFMTAMDDLNKSLTSNVALGDAKASAADAKEMQAMFNEVEAHFAKKGDAPDGVKWSQESRELAALIEKSVSENNFDQASQTAVTLSKTCKACHKIYKKKN